MMDAEEILKRASGRSRTVWVCPDAALYSQWQEAEQHYERARKASGSTLGDDSEAEQLKAEAERLRGEVDGALVDLELREVPPPRVRRLQADHALSRKDAQDRGLRPGAVDPERFYPALAAESIVSPEFTVEQAEQLLASSQLVQGPIIAALDELHGQVTGDPKAQVDTAAAASSDSSSTPPQS